MKVFIDTNIPMYAAGKEHPCKAGSIEILEAVANNKFEAYTDTEVFQEILYRYYHINQVELGLQVFDHFSLIMNGFVLPVTPGDISQARLLLEKEQSPGLSPRDLIHLAVMLNNDINTLISTDKNFEKIAGINVITP